MTARTATVPRSVMDATLPFALPIGLSAFLLFSVEPLIGRLVLPVFGGTPAVWATVLFFFQAILLVGYLYGHVSVTRLGRWGPPVHLALAGLAFYMLLNAPSTVGDLRNEAVTPVVDLVGILFALIGLPALVLTTTTPLLSGWFHASSDREGDPYWLYALSNAGSLIALLAYPLVIEPRIGLATQRGLWTVGYVALVALITMAVLRALPELSARRRGTYIAQEPPTGLPAAESPHAAAEIDGRRRLRWLLLAAVPSGLLTAVTNFIATDLVSAPLLWVIPLAIYLASFVIAFSPRGGRLVRLAVVSVPAAVTLMWVPYGATGFWPIVAILAVELVSFALIAIGLHGRLALDRPDPAHLTEFYLILSTGGALASFLVAIVAPSVFPDVWEYPILLVAALAALALSAGPTRARSAPRTGGGLDFGPFFAGFVGRVAPFAVGAAILVGLLVGSGIQLLEPAIWLAIGGLILAVGGRPGFLVFGSAVVLVIATIVPAFSTEFRGRSFFGVTEVLRRDTIVLLMNGTTLHGAQFTDPSRRGIPTTYYGPTGPAGDVFAVGADATAVATKNVAIVGLGAGALAAYKTNWMTMTYFEIDPIVISVASDPRFFTFLSEAPGAPDIVEGDARLSLADEPDAQFDLVVLDAFSSDAIPVHLLTVEAIADQSRTLKSGGMLAFHISNRHYTLEPAISAALGQLGFTPLERSSRQEDPADDFQYPSQWLVGARTSEQVNGFRARGWRDAELADHPFTDDYADLLSYLKLGF